MQLLSALIKIKTRFKIFSLFFFLPVITWGQTYTVTTFAGSGTATFTNGTGALASFNAPIGVVVDGTGNVYVADAINNRIRKITASGVVTTLAGSGTATFADGTRTSASFNNPIGVALDAAGNIYVADAGNNRIRKITSSGVVTTLAGSGTASFANGTGSAASFNGPIGVALDAAGNVYVGDANNNRIRKITSLGVVTTFAGSGTAAFADGTGSAASFRSPSGIALDQAGNVYVADAVNNRIRKITASGVVTTLAGSGAPSYADGTGSSASFKVPTGVAVDNSGNVFVADRQNNRIRKITPLGAVSTITGSGTSAYADGIGAAASFFGPYGLAIDASGNIYVADAGNNRIRKIFPCAINIPTVTGNTSICVGNSSTLTSSAATGYLWNNGETTQNITITAAGSYSVRVIEGVCTSASSSQVDVLLIQTPLPNTPTISGNTTITVGGSTQLSSSSVTGNLWSNGETTQSITVNKMGRYSVQLISGTCTSANSNILVVDFDVSAYNVSTLAGSGTAVFANGTGTAASFSSPKGVAVDAAGNVYVADAGNNRIRKITESGVVTTIAGGSGPGSFADGVGTSAIFNNPSGLAVDLAGNVYVADAYNNRIRKITSSGVVTTIAGSGTAAFADGVGIAASFNGPTGLAIDAFSNLYVADLNNHRIRKITLSGVVSTLAGSGNGTFADGIGIAASFRNPSGVALDANGYIYVIEAINNRIRKITSNGVVTTLAGSGSGTITFADGTGTVAAFNRPNGISIDAANNLFVADTYNNRVRKSTTSGLVTTISGTGSTAYANGIATEASFNLPFGVAIDAEGNIYVADCNNHRIRKISPCTTPTTPVLTGYSSLCTGNSTILTSSAATGNLWSNSATTQSITVTNGGNYSVQVVSGACTSLTSNIVVVTVTDMPASPTISGNATFCSGTSTILTSSSVTGNLWSNNATTQSITVSSEGNYSVQIVVGACTSLASNISAVSEVSLPSTPTISGNNTLCTGGFTVLTSSAATGNLWSNNATTQSITVNTPADFSVRVISSGCTSATSNVVTVSLNELPTTPTITSNNGTALCIGESTILSTSAATSYLWSTNATTQSISVNNAGSYTVSITNSNGCTSEVSSPVIITSQVCTFIFNGVGYFNEAVRWNSGNIPTTGADIIVQGTLTLPSSVSLRNISVEAGASINIPTGITLTLTGNLSNQGIISGEGTVRLAGLNNQNFGGGIVSNLFVNNTSTVVQSSATQISNSLTLGTNQILNLNNATLTLQSTATQTARLASVPSNSSITNSSNFTVQRWLNSANVRAATNATGNYYFTGPVLQDQSVGLWNSVSPYGPETFNQATSNGGRFYFFDVVTPNYKKPTSLSQALPAGKGVQVWFGTLGFFTGGRNTWSVTGSPVVGNFNLPLTNGVTGFNLVSNPYPSTIDWDNESWTKIGLANAIYIYDWVNLRYRTYVNNIGVNGGSRYLPTAQGFFVSSTNASPILTATENIKVSNQVAMQRNESNANGLIRMQLTNGTITDEIVIANRPSASIAFEADQDAQKMMNPTTNVFVSGQVNQSIASMNLIGVNSIPFVIQSNGTGSVTLATTELNSLEDYTFNLFDEQTGELLPYTGTETYTFNVTANQPYRLLLRIGSVSGVEIFKANTFEVYPNPATDKVTIRTNGTGTIEIVNNLCQVLITQPAIETNEINVSQLAKGVYTVKFNGVSQKLVVK